MAKLPPKLISEIQMENYKSLDTIESLNDAIKKITKGNEKDLQKLVEQLGSVESNAHDYYLEEYSGFKDNRYFSSMELKRKDGRPIMFRK